MFPRIRIGVPCLDGIVDKDFGGFVVMSGVSFGGRNSVALTFFTSASNARIIAKIACRWAIGVLMCSSH